MQLNNKGVAAGGISQKGNQKLILLDPNARVSHQQFGDVGTAYQSKEQVLYNTPIIPSNNDYENKANGPALAMQDLGGSSANFLFNQQKALA